jgi:hypothetical protein
MPKFSLLLCFCPKFHVLPFLCQILTFAKSINLPLPCGYPIIPWPPKKKPPSFPRFAKQNKKILTSYNSPLKVPKFKIPSIQNGNYIFFHGFSRWWKDVMLSHLLMVQKHHSRIFMHDQMSWPFFSIEICV